MYVANRRQFEMRSPLLSSGGTPIGFTLRTNLSDSFAVSLDDVTSYVAVGASEGIPAGGTLLKACVVGQEGCDIGVRIP